VKIQGRKLADQDSRSQSAGAHPVQVHGVSFSETTLERLFDCVLNHGQKEASAGFKMNSKTIRRGGHKRLSTAKRATGLGQTGCKERGYEYYRSNACAVIATHAALGCELMLCYCLLDRRAAHGMPCGRHLLVRELSQAASLIFCRFFIAGLQDR
jgi:hypothetical protein